jgi:hypothetical protein
MPLTPTSTNNGIVLTEVAAAITPEIVKKAGMLVASQPLRIPNQKRPHQLRRYPTFENSMTTLTVSEERFPQRGGLTRLYPCWVNGLDGIL